MAQALREIGEVRPQRNDLLRGVGVGAHHESRIYCTSL